MRNIFDFPDTDHWEGAKSPARSTRRGPRPPIRARATLYTRVRSTRFGQYAQNAQLLSICPYGTVGKVVQKDGAQNVDREVLYTLFLGVTFARWAASMRGPLGRGTIENV